MVDWFFLKREISDGYSISIINRPLIFFSVFVLFFLMMMMKTLEHRINIWHKLRFTEYKMVVSGLFFFSSAVMTIISGFFTLFRRWYNSFLFRWNLLFVVVFVFRNCWNYFKFCFLVCLDTINWWHTHTQTNQCQQTKLEKKTQKI